MRRSLTLSSRDWMASLYFVFDDVQIADRSVPSNKCQWSPNKAEAEVHARANAKAEANANA